ncbi:MAG: hypothetical protein ABJ239_12660 [Erythrobacter sp.]
MFSRLLACFALVSGFAAIAAPVSASEVEALTCQMDASGHSNAMAQDQHQTSIVMPVTGISSRIVEDAQPIEHNDAPACLTVRIRIDRAYE